MVGAKSRGKNNAKSASPKKSTAKPTTFKHQVSDKNKPKSQSINAKSPTKFKPGSGDGNSAVSSKIKTEDSSDPAPLTAGARPKRLASRNVQLYIRADAAPDTTDDESDVDKTHSRPDIGGGPDAAELEDPDADHSDVAMADSPDQQDEDGMRHEGFFDFEAEEIDAGMEEASGDDEQDADVKEWDDNAGDQETDIDDNGDSADEHDGGGDDTVDVKEDGEDEDEGNNEGKDSGEGEDEGEDEDENGSDDEEDEEERYKPTPKFGSSKDKRKVAVKKTGIPSKTSVPGNTTKSRSQPPVVKARKSTTLKQPAAVSQLAIAYDTSGDDDIESDSLPETISKKKQPARKHAPAQMSTTSRSKGVGRVVVKEVDHKFVVPSTFGPDVPTTPVSAKRRVASNPTDSTFDTDLNTSPKKKSRLAKGKGKANVGDASQNVMDTPVTGVSRYLAASQIASSDNEEGDDLSTREKDMVSDPTNIAHCRFMCRDMIETYKGRLAPPLIRSAKQIAFTGQSTDKTFISFRSAMNNVGIAQGTPLFAHLLNLVTHAAFGPYLYNLARIDVEKIIYTPIRVPGKTYDKPQYNYTVNLTGSSDYKATNSIAFVMFGTVAESHVTRSTIQRYGKHRRSLCIKPLTMEFYRSVNVLATLWGIEPPYSLEVTKNEGGFMFYTLPTDTPFGPQDKLPNGHGSGSEESDVDLPDSSIGGVPVTSPVPTIAQARQEIEMLAHKGSLYDEKIPIYDFTNALTQQDLLPLNQELLTGATVWTRGEIPVGSFVCVHYVPGMYQRGRTRPANGEAQFNLIRVVVLKAA